MVLGVAKCAIVRLIPNPAIVVLSVYSIVLMISEHSRCGVGCYRPASTLVRSDECAVAVNLSGGIMPGQKLQFKIEIWQIPIGESFKATTMLQSIIDSAERLTGYKFEVTGKWGDFTVTRVS